MYLSTGATNGSLATSALQTHVLSVSIAITRHAHIQIEGIYPTSLSAHLWLK